MASKTIRQSALKGLRLAQIDALLDVCGLGFDVKNEGQHYIITGPLKTIDYWPSTGKYRVRKGGSGDYEYANEFCAFALRINNLFQV